MDNIVCIYLDRNVCSQIGINQLIKNACVDMDNIACMYLDRNVCSQIGINQLIKNACVDMDNIVCMYLDRNVCSQIGINQLIKHACVDMDNIVCMYLDRTVCSQIGINQSDGSVLSVRGKPYFPDWSSNLFGKQKSAGSVLFPDKNSPLGCLCLNICSVTFRVYGWGP